MIQILVGGDIVPLGRIQGAFEAGKASDIFGDLLHDIAAVDFSVANLECPLVSRETPIAKSGAILGASTSCIRGLAASGWSALNLANNHSFDHGLPGLRATLRTIQTAGIDHLGAGMSLEEAREPLVKEIRGQRIAVYAMAEREFSIADRNSAGANPLDLIGLVNAIQEHKKQGIFIVLIHGGREHSAYPSPEMVKRCRFMVEQGADAVICCHAHCPQPWEFHSNKPIIYGLGNLVFEGHQGLSRGWREGYLAKLTLEAEQIHFEAIPYFQSKDKAGVRKMDGGDREHFLSAMSIKSARIKDDGFIHDHWEHLCRSQRQAYLTSLFGYNPMMKKLGSFWLKTLHRKSDILEALHLVQCETHQEVLQTIFENERRTAEGRSRPLRRVSGGRPHREREREGPDEAAGDSGPDRSA